MKAILLLKNKKIQCFLGSDWFF